MGWDFFPIAENGVAVYIFMAESDEYYGAEKARDAYNGIRDAYRENGWTDTEIERVLQAEIPDDAYFNERGIYESASWIPLEHDGGYGWETCEKAV